MSTRTTIRKGLVDRTSRRLSTTERRRLVIELNTALRMSPTELRNALALEEDQIADLEPVDAAEPGDPSDEAAAFEDMDGDESEPDEEIPQDSTDRAIGLLLNSGALRLPVESSPYLDLSAIYVLAVDPNDTVETANCYFEAPTWFDRTRRQGRGKVRRVATVLRALTDLLSQEFPQFLADPTPTRLASCEWQYLSRSSAPFTRTILVRQGLAERVNQRLGDDDRVDAANLGELIPHVWLLWPPDAASNGERPLSMPFNTIYQRAFQARAAAFLCRAGFDAWRLETADRPTAIKAKSLADRSFRSLDQEERLHLISSKLRLKPAALLEDVMELGSTVQVGATQKGASR